MVDPITATILLNLISSGISAGLNKAAHKIFRPQEIEDYLKSTSFQYNLEQELSFLEGSEIDITALEAFFNSDKIICIFSQIYEASEKTLSEIESEFVKDFCEIKPITNQSNEEFGKKLFFCIKQAFNAFLQRKILEGEIVALEYKSEERHKELRDGQNRMENLLEDVVSEVKSPHGFISSKVPLDYIDEEFKEVIELIGKNEIEEAKTKLFAVIGVMENKPQENKKLLSRAYHLLAITYNKNKGVGGNFDTAEHYAKRSLEFDPLNDKIKGTLASIYINKHGKENFEKSFSISAPLWEQSEQNNPQFLEVYLWGLFFTKSVVDAIVFFESSKNAQDLTEQNDLLSNLIARFYIVNNNPRKSLQYINNSIKLDPQNPDHYAIKASAYREISLAEDYLFSDFEICPKLKKYDCIEKALEYYRKALSLCHKNTDPTLIERIKKEIYTCSILLNRSNEKEFQIIRFSINSSQLPENEQHTLEFLDFVNELNACHFSSASQKLFSLRMWEEFTYETKIKFALVFLHRGSPEEAKKIFKSLESEAESKKDIRFLINMSIIEVLLNNKTGMLQYLEKAKDASKGSSEWEERVLSHSYTMIQRYRDSGKENDRMLASIQEYDDKFPDRKILKVISVNENDEKPPQEIIDEFKRAFERDQNIKRICTEHQVPIYVIANVTYLNYAEMVNKLTDTQFHIRYHPPDQASQQEMMDNYDAGEVFVFDYSSLLNLSKMDLLGELERIQAKLFISKSLFEKIQLDLIFYEDPNLRKLWDYLRNSNSISIVDIEADPSDYQEISKHLDKWIIDSIKLLSIYETSILLSDDFNLIRLFKEYKIRGTTTFFFLSYLLENKFVDSKTYGVAIGVLAERMYIFLPFDGEDLYHIAMDDECKIKLRSYHLINHITVPGISPLIYTRQFEYFIDKLWRSGSLFEDKVNWLALITERMIFAINQRHDIGQTFEVDMLLYDIKKIWKNISSLCTLSDLTILEERCITLFETEPSNDLKESILSVINQSRDVLSYENNQLSEH
ncbi:tetratricopeptide repeat protein [Methanogenium organophilum]|uniref:Tetratricopeptide repeat protein n=1 Tax=Methanogenium organophilum TaxID=2199 RepID=A0A9X9S421_METOG|nr:hypothetical protein [Methanogenium organophilum]WAI01110.1 hypothetical protein OU421_11910 [Methanogenium organophilum]